MRVLLYIYIVIYILCMDAYIYIIYIVLLQGKHSHAFSDSDVQRNSTEHARISSAGPHLFQMGSSDKASELKHWERAKWDYHNIYMYHDILIIYGI